MSKEYKTKYSTWIRNYFETHRDVRVTAKDIYEKMIQEGMTANLTTVYRNLDRLEKECFLQGHKASGEDEKFYHFADPDRRCANHLHLLCSGCGKIIHLNCGFMDEISSHLLKDHGFELNCGESMLVGLCADCRKKQRIAAHSDNGGAAGSSVGCKPQNDVES